MSGKERTQTYLLSASSWKRLLTKPRQKRDPASKYEKIFSMTSSGILIPVKSKSIKNIFIYWILLMTVFTGVLEFHSKYILIFKQHHKVHCYRKIFTKCLIIRTAVIVTKYTFWLVPFEDTMAQEVYPLSFIIKLHEPIIR